MIRKIAGNKITAFQTAVLFPAPRVTHTPAQALIYCKNIWLEVFMQTVTQHTLTDTMYVQDIPVLNCQVRYPQFITACNPAAANSINGHYTTQTREKGVYCRNELLPQAAEEAVYDHRRHFPFYPYEFDVNYVVSYNVNCITSLYTDQYTFTGGAHGSTLRTSDTWDFETGRRLSLRDFYRYNPLYLQEIQSWVEYQISQRLKADPAAYFDNYAALLRNTFHPENYYLSPKGIILYYQQYDIAPYSSGIPEFLIPYGSETVC